MECTDCIQCDTCHNWFHFECSNLSKKHFNRFVNGLDIKYICKICKYKTTCIHCNCALATPNKSLYCVGCLDKCCLDCLSLDTQQIRLFTDTDKPYFCEECSKDHFCNICSGVCVDGCIYCDSCHSWLHYKCTKLTKSQLISFSKTSKKYYCNVCIMLNIPFSNVSASKLHHLNNTDEVCPVPNQTKPYVSPLTNNDSCDLCLECNPECFSCVDSICPDPRRICETCLICKYLFDTTELNNLYLDFVSKFKNSLSALHFNTRSLPLHINSLKDVIAQTENKIDLIGISETRLIDDSETQLKDDSVLSKIQIDGYYFVHTPTNSSCGGAGLYISKKLDFVRRRDFEFKIASCETCFIELFTHNKQKNIIIGVIYRHPHDNHTEFIHKLQCTAENILKKYSLIILGDININVSVPNDLFAKMYKDALLGLDIKNLISRPTRITNTSETIIDHILTSLPLDTVRSGILINDMTDHLPVYALFNISPKRRYFRPVFYRSFKSSKKGDFAVAFTNILSSMNLDSNTDPDTHLECVIKAMADAVDEVFPLRKRSNKQLKKFRNAWITQGILNSIQRCHYLHYTSLVKKDDLSEREYKSYKLKLVRTIEKAKDSEKHETFMRCSGDSKKTWEAINDTLNNKSSRSNDYLPGLKDENNCVVSDPKLIANKLNSHFAQKRLNLASKLPNSNSSIYSCLGERSETTIPTNAIVSGEVLKCIQDLKSSNEARLLKWLHDKIAPVLTNIFNKFFEVGRYPNILKIAKVTAIFKGGDKQNCENYRPISVLPQINKIFEKVIKNRLNSFLVDINFFYPIPIWFSKKSLNISWYCSPE